MNEYAFAVICVVLALLTVFQLLMIGGVPLGRFAWGGQQEILEPKRRVLSGVAIGLYSLFGLIAYFRITHHEEGVIAAILLWISYLICAYMALSVVMNLASKSPAEKFVMTPVSLILTACYIVIALHS